jgi:hypothetical protein
MKRGRRRLLPPLVSAVTKQPTRTSGWRAGGKAGAAIGGGELLTSRLAVTEPSFTEAAPCPQRLGSAAPGVRPRGRRPVPIRRSRSRNIRGRNPARRELARLRLPPWVASPVFPAGEFAEPPLALSSMARKIAPPRPSSPWGIALPPEGARAGRPSRRAVAKASARPPGFRTQGWAQVPADLAVSGAVLRPPGFRPRLFVAP